MNGLVETVRESLADETRPEFDRRVETQAERLRQAVRSDGLENRDFAVGLELEAYGIDGAGRLVSVPTSVFAPGVCEAELGAHNVETNPEPDALAAATFDRQAVELRTRLEQARLAAAEADIRLVLDGMWTVPPPEGTEPYLTAYDECDGVRVAENMRHNSRYHTLDNDVLRRSDWSVPLSVPGFDGTFPSILVESLAASMQPHLQVPSADDFPRYFNTAIRTLGPVVALAANSPFLPADLYSTGVDAEAVLAETPAELRILVFEQAINCAVDDGSEKVRVPRDLADLGDAIERIVADETVAPVLFDSETDDHGFPEFDHKRSTFWRWVRPVFGGEIPTGRVGRPVAAGNTPLSVRLEYRALAAQPTVTDVVAVQALVVGALRGLVEGDHPLETVPWHAAERSFYAAVHDGLDAELAWVTEAGERTTDSTVVYDELFRFARRGLAASSLDGGAIDALLAPVEGRWTSRTTPSEWKRERVAEGVAAGASLSDAIISMQGEYVRRAAAGEPFVEWG